MKPTAALLLLLLPTGAYAGRPLQLTDYYKVETASAPAISPDGRRVVFVRNYIVEAENKRQTELWIAPSDGASPAMRIAGTPVGASAPRWSPDGKLLAYRAGGAGRGRGGAPGSASGGASEDGGIWFLRMDGGNPAGEPFQIVGVGGAPVFSPDNRWIAFTKRTPPVASPSELSAQDKLLAERFKGRVYDWMNIRFDGRGYLPDPRDAAATPPNELYMVSREGGEPKQLTHLGVDVKTPEWRPDSGALAIVADSHQRDEYSYERSDLFTVTVDGALQRLTDDGFEYDSPAYTADGKSLVFRRRQSLTQVIQAKQHFGGAVRIYRMPAAGGKMANLTGDWDLIPDAPVVARDAVYFGAQVGGDTQLFRVAPGSAPVQVTRGAGSLGGFSFSAAFDRMAYTAVDPTHPADVFAAAISGKDEARLSTLNDEWLKDVELSAAKRIRYPSKDGTQIDGWVVLPHDAKPASPAPPILAPLILAIHGGPHGAYGDLFDFEFQLLAANGYAVVYTNPRGSTGYGEKFLWATWGGWGKLDYDDVMGGVDYTVAHFPVDAKHLGVTGYSYGGYLTNWIITQTPRFSAAVAGAGISNWISDYGTADIPRSKESEFYGAPWQAESAALMRAQSPLTYAGRVKTPTLFVHGEADRRVPIEEAEQMYTALKKLRVPAKFVRYPGNFHGGWPAWDMVHRYNQELQWWNQYLKGPAKMPTGN